MVPIYCINIDYFDYANKIKNILQSFDIQSQVQERGSKSIEELVDDKPNSYKIIVCYSDVENNNVCIRKNSNQVDNINLNQFGNYVKNFMV